MAGEISLMPFFSWAILALIAGLAGLLLWRNRKNKKGGKSWSIIIPAIVAGLIVVFFSIYTFSYDYTESGFIGSLDWSNSTQQTVVATQAERDYAYERCARDMQNFDGPLCNKIKNGEVPIPDKYILTHTMTDQDILVEVRKVPEFQAFNEKYPTAIEVIWREGTAAYVKYVEVRLRSGGNDSPINESEALHLLVKFDSIGRTSFEYQCGATVTTENVLETIRNSECPD